MRTRPDPWYLEPGVVIMVTAPDLAGRPALCRAIGARYAPDGRTLIIYVPVPEGLEVLDHVSTNGHVAVGFARVRDYRSIQFKGVDARIVADPDPTRTVEQCIEGHIAAMTALDMPEELLRGLWSAEGVAIGFTPNGAWDQTPGPGAGREVPT